MKLLIKNGRVIDPANKLDNILDILVDEGKISKIEKKIKAESISNLTPSQVIDASGKIVVPGLIDMHTHLREPGYEYKENIESGTKAAAAGGFTSVACMPNTNPVNDDESVTGFILAQRQKLGVVNIFPVGAITKGLKGERLAEIGGMKEAGIVAVSDDGHPVMDAEIMRRAMEYANMFDLPVISHCEDLNLASNGVINEGFVSTELGFDAIPNIAEEVMVARDIALAEWTGARLHIAHISTAKSVELVRQAKKRGVRVTAEATPHHFSLTDEVVRSFDTGTKVNPPLRAEKDVQAVKAGLSDGTIDVIASDHAPHAVYEKDVEYKYAPFGIAGLETALSLSLSLVHEGVLSIQDLVSKLANNPAKILNLDKGIIKVGMDADITIIDMDKEYKVDINKFQSKDRNSPFHNWTLKGRAEMVIIGGKVIP